MGPHESFVAVHRQSFVADLQWMFHSLPILLPHFPFALEHPLELCSRRDALAVGLCFCQLGLCRVASQASSCFVEVCSRNDHFAEEISISISFEFEAYRCTPGAKNLHLPIHGALQSSLAPGSRGACLSNCNRRRLCCEIVVLVHE